MKVVKSSTFKNIGTVTFYSSVGYGLAFVLQIVLASKYGTGQELDAYLAAIVIPNSIFAILTSAFSKTFIPVFIGYRNEETEKEAWKVAWTTLIVASTVLLLLTLMVALGAPLIISLTAPGFRGDLKELTIRITRILAPLILLSGATGLLSSLFNANNRFSLPAVGPAIGNFVIITLILLLEGGWGVYALIAGAIFGGGIRTLTLAPILRKRGFAFDLGHPGLRQVGLIAGPLIVVGIFTQAHTLIERLLASLLEDGSISQLNFANNLVRLVVFLLSSISVVMFPSFSEFVSRGERDKLIENMSLALRMTMFLVIPAAVGVAILRVPIIRLLFERGEFSSGDTLKVAFALLCYSGALVGLALGGIITTVYYALKDTKTVVWVSVIGTALYVILGLVLIRYLRVGGVALAFSTEALVNLMILMVLLRKKMDGVDGRRILVSLVKISFSSVVMGAVVLLASNEFSKILDLNRVFHQIGLIGASVALGLVSYSLAAILLRTDEMTIILDVVRERLSRTSIDT